MFTFNWARSRTSLSVSDNSNHSVHYINVYKVKSLRFENLPYTQLLFFDN